ncbi:OsmC family protein [Nocardioides sp. BP30]|uniref:OsmC family protein n=1 Tax=Nocardioides sp. BP30 TaxID=3036374 RepID=UPI002469499D|nr:OsmC family protein [Nocardioides sp. BP30]WGL53361.1 OsmC family protein [Nocardioides sp. BP30]
MAELSAFGVRAGAGSLRADADAGAVVLPHSWTPQGVLAAPVTNGAQALHLAVALCVLNDVYREAAASGIEIGGVAVEADGAFDDAWASTGIHYRVEVDTAADEATLVRLLTQVEHVAEIPRALGAGAKVQRR